jgi:hypothetical protein
MKRCNRSDYRVWPGTKSIEIDVETQKMKTKQERPMKTRLPSNNVEESTYALLVRSEDKKRALFETILYSLVAVAVLVAIVQFADQPVSFVA